MNHFLKDAGEFASLYMEGKVLQTGGIVSAKGMEVKVSSELLLSMEWSRIGEGWECERGE